MIIMSIQLQELLKDLSNRRLMRISKECPYIFLRGRYFIPTDETLSSKTSGILAFFGNYHYLSVSNEFLEDVSEKTKKRVKTIICREKEMSVCEAYEFLSLEVKTHILEIQSIVTPYHPNFSVWFIRGIDQFLGDLEEEMIREGVSLSVINDVQAKLIEIGKLVHPKLTQLSEMEDKLSE